MTTPPPTPQRDSCTTPGCALAREHDGFCCENTRGQVIAQHDAVAHPAHYTSSPAVCSGCGKTIECIDVVQHMPFNLGSVVKYVWRHDLKDDAIEDLRKAVWYLEREIARREKATPTPRPARRVRTIEEVATDHLRGALRGLR